MPEPKPTQPKTNHKKHLTFSEAFTFKKCRQSWQLAYVDKITPKITKPALHLGRLVHEAVATLYQSYLTDKPITAEQLCSKFLALAEAETKSLEDKWGADHLAAEIALLDHQKNLGLAMVHGYHQFSSMHDRSFSYETINYKSPVEIKFTVPIITPNGNPSPKFVFTGRIDGLVRYLGKYWVHELKTAASWDSANLDLLPIDPQVNGYIYAAEKFFNIPIAGAIYSVIKKSQLRLRKNESVEMLRSRIIQDYNSRPDFYFIRHPIYANRESVDIIPYQLWEVCKDMTNARIYKNVGRFTCGLGCSYVKLCTAYDANQYSDIKEMFFRDKTSQHEELEG